MHVNPSTARLTLTDLAQRVANADTTRSGPRFAGTLRQVRAENRIVDAPHGPPSAPGRTDAHFAKPTGKVEVPAPRPLTEDTAEPARASTPTLHGDINADGIVDVFDSARLATAYGSDDPDADLDGNGTVDEIDALILRKNFGRTAGDEQSPDAVPADQPTADLNGDGRVDVLDFGQLAAAYGSDNPDADLFQDGIVDEIDVAIFRHLMNQNG